MTTWKDELFINICSSFRLGYSPVAPGTVGSLPAVVLYCVIAIFASAQLQPILLAAALIVSSVLCVALGPWAEGYLEKERPQALRSR
jgi:hypothetical protein